MSWKDLNNDLSDPSFSRMTFPNAPDSIISKFMAKGIFNFFPFKVVNLKWLIDIGKATQAPKGEGYQTTNCGVYHFYAMTFNKDDKYLPVGDVVINMDKSPENGRWCNGNSNPVLDLTKVFILLVKNDSKYSTIIKDSDWKFVSRSRDCNTPITWAFRAVVNNNRNYNTDYNVIGDSFKNWNHGDGWWPDGNSCLLPNNPFDRKERPIAAVHTNFLSVNKSKSKQDTDVKSFELNGDFGCRYRHFLSATSPFNTFNVSADEDTRGRVEMLMMVIGVIGQLLMGLLLTGLNINFMILFLSFLLLNVVLELFQLILKCGSVEDTATPLLLHANLKWTTFV